MSSIAILTDEAGQIIGQKDRHKLQEGDMIAIASLWLENDKGEVLIAQRSLDKKVDPGLWGPAAAGTLEPGETFESNIVKEAEEEIGLTGISPEEIHRLSYWREDGVGRYAVWYRALADWPVERFRLQTEEVASVRWIAKDDLLAETKQHPELFVGWPERWKLMIDLTTGV